MRVIYLHQYFNTNDMGRGTRSYEMARHLVARGHEVHMVTSWREDDGRRGWFRTEEAGIHVHWVPVPYSNYLDYAARMRAFLRFAWRAARKAASLPGDVVFATSTPLTIALPAVYASRRKAVPMVFEVRDLWPAVPIAMGVLKNPVLRKSGLWLETFAYFSSRQVVALTPGMKEEIAATGYPRSRVSVVPNGSDIDLFASASAAGETPRAQHDWLGNRRLVVYAGSLGPAHGVSYLPPLAAEVAKLSPEIRFAVIGFGKEEDRIRAAARKAGVLDRSLFMLGPMTKRQVAAWFSAADITIALINPEIEVLWRHAVQNKFFDSLAAGRPVACNVEGWQARIAVKAGAGIILPAYDPAAAARQLVDRLDDEAWCARAGAAARRLAVERFDQAKLAEQLEDVLVKAVSEGRGFRWRGDAAFSAASKATACWADE